MLEMHISWIISSNLGKIHVTGIIRLTTVLKFNIEFVCCYVVFFFLFCFKGFLFYFNLQLID